MLLFRRIENTQQSLARLSRCAEFEMVHGDACHDRLGTAFQVLERHIGEVGCQETADLGFNR